VFTDQTNTGFYRVWEKENLTYGKLAKAGPGSDPKHLEIVWQNDHVVKKDALILGEIDNRTLLFYSFGDECLVTYDLQKMGI
jgi:hypothetical protein